MFRTRGLVSHYYFVPLMCLLLYLIWTQMIPGIINGTMH